MRKIKTLIVDDEPQAREVIRLLIEHFFEHLTVVAEAATAREAVIHQNSTPADLIMLDVDMPGGSGFDFLEKFPDRNFKVIFTTASSEHAIKAIKARAEDYLLKPLDIEEFKKAIDQLEFDNLEPASVLTQGKMQLKIDNNQTVILPYNDIIHLSNAGNYTTFHLKENKKHIVSKNLGYFMDKLPEFQFFRCHQSHCINIKEIKKYNKSDSTLLMSNDITVEVSRAKKKDFENLLEKNNH